MHSATVATIFSVAVSASYVGAVRCWIPAHLQDRDRDDAEVVKQRLRRVTWLCAVLAVLDVAYLIKSGAVQGVCEAASVLGLLPGLTLSESFRNDIASVAAGVQLVVTLYSGPIFLWLHELWGLGTVRRAAHSVWEAFHQSFFLLHGFRDHIFGPLTEELVFRAIAVSLWYPLDPSSYRVMVVWLPLLFGVAHVHHAYGLYTRDHVSLGECILIALFQLAYTWIFGMLSVHLYLSSHHNLWCCVLVHSVCNLMGFPPITVSANAPIAFIYYILIAYGIYFFFTHL